MGYKDKFGNALKEDGLVGGKTLFAYDTFFNDKNADFPTMVKAALAAASFKPKTATKKQENENFLDKLDDAADWVGDKLNDGVEWAKEKIEDGIEWAGDKFEDVKDFIFEKLWKPVYKDKKDVESEKSKKPSESTIQNQPTTIDKVKNPVETNKAIDIKKPKDPDKLSPSNEILEFIKNYEGGLRLKRYDATSKGDWTIGYGHSLDDDDTTMSITKEEADKYFEVDIEKMLTTTFIPFLKKNNIELTQNQFDAMVSFTFNFGENTWGPNGYETIKNFLIKGDYSEEATRKAFAMYMGGNAQPGHIKRRNDEIEMFLYGDYKRDENDTRP